MYLGRVWANILMQLKFKILLQEMCIYQIINCLKLMLIFVEKNQGRTMIGLWVSYIFSFINYSKIFYKSLRAEGNLINFFCPNLKLTPEQV
jgi:hypothetical protein